MRHDEFAYLQMKDTITKTSSIKDIAFDFLKKIYWKGNLNWFVWLSFSWQYWKHMQWVFLCRKGFIIKKED